jgi:hypothetical protein
VFDGTFDVIRLGDVIKLIGNGDNDVGKKKSVRPSCLGAFLSLLHFGSRHHLHGTGYLARVLDAFDPDPDISGVCHRFSGKITNNQANDRFQSSIALLRFCSVSSSSFPVL